MLLGVMLWSTMDMNHILELNLSMKRVRLRVRVRVRLGIRLGIRLRLRVRLRIRIKVRPLPEHMALCGW